MDFLKADVDKMIETFIDRKDVRLDIDYTHVKAEYLDVLWTDGKDEQKEYTEVLCPFFNRTTSPQLHKIEETSKVRHHCSVEFTSALFMQAEVHMPLQLPRHLWKSDVPDTVQIRGGRLAEFHNERMSKQACEVTVKPGTKVVARLTTEHRVYTGNFTRNVLLRGTAKVNMYKNGVHADNRGVNMRELVENLLARGANLLLNVTDYESSIDGITVQVDGKAVFESFDKGKIDVHETKITAAEEKILNEEAKI